MKKKLVRTAEFSSIFHDCKWLVEIRIQGFNNGNKGDMRKKNYQFIHAVEKLIKKYNGVNLNSKSLVKNEK